MQTTSEFMTVIDAIFDKLAVRYGAEWLHQWNGLDMDLVKADWAEELGGFARNLEPLRHALKNLPERCPRVGQFKALANTCPLPEFKQLPAPHSTPEYAKQVTSVVKQKASGFAKRDPKQWAFDLRNRHERGEKLGAHQITAYRQALGMEGRQSWQ